MIHLKGIPILKFFAAVAGLKPVEFLSSVEGAADNGAGAGRGNLPGDSRASDEESLLVSGSLEEFPVERRRFRKTS